MKIPSKCKDKKSHDFRHGGSIVRSFIYCRKCGLKADDRYGDEV